MRSIQTFSILKSALIVAIISLLALTAPTAVAQTQGRITGRVTDSTGAVIVDAKVTIENRGKGVKRTLDTNSSGDYVAPGLEPGVYSITVEAPNFKKTVRESVQIEVAKDLKIDFQLTPGAASEVLEVKDESPLVDATTSTLEGVLSNKAINELPLQGRDFQNLLDLHPGVQRTAGGGFHSVTSNGLRTDDNNFVIDGANDNDAYWGETVVNDAGIEGTPASILPLDAIQEFNTQEHPQADFGQKPGVVVNIGIKSGTDQIHGSAYYFHRNEALDSRNYFDHGTDPLTGGDSKAAALLLHQFGASIGGPIIKGKWFYFANYEGLRSKVGNPFQVFTPVTTSLGGDPEFSTVDALAECQENDNCNPLSVSLLQYFPVNPGFTADPDDPTIMNFNFNNTTRSDNLVFKSDYHLNDHHVITGRYIYANTNQTEEDGSALAPQWLSHAAPITQVFGIDWTWTPNSRWVNTARFSRNSFYEKITPVDGGVNPTQYGLVTGVTDPRLFGFPIIYPSTDDFDHLGGVSGWPTWTAPSHTENYSDTASYTAGKHTIRFGGDFSNGGVDYLRAGRGRGEVDFETLQDFMTGNVQSWSLQYGDPKRDIHMRAFSLFAQDDFRVTRRLTLNLGLRYDVTRPIRDSQNRLANFDPSKGVVQVGFGIDEPYKTNWKNISPRLGFAWDAFGTGKTVIRGGFGMIYVAPSIRTFMFSSGGLHLNPSALVQPGANGNITTFLQSGAPTDLINWSQEGPIFPGVDNVSNTCSADSPCDIFGVDQNLKTPYVLNWNFNVQQQIAPNTVLQIGYVANRGVQLYSDIDLNQADPQRSLQLITAAAEENDESITDLFDDWPIYEQQARPFVTNCDTGSGPCFPYIRFLNFLGNQSTSGYHSLQTTLTHRYSKGLYLLAGYTWAHAIDTAGNTSNLGFAPQNSFDYAAEKGDGDYDIRHRFTLSATYDLPARKSWGQLLEGWQVTGIFQAETGQPVLQYDNSDDLTLTGEGPGNANNDRWNIVGDPGKFKVSPHGFERHFAGDPVCDSVATTQELQDALNWAGWCWESNGTIIYPNAFGTYGNMGRNILRGPKFVNLDFSAGKSWKLTERLKLQFRAEVFNILNHANFSSPSGSLASRNMGKLRNTPDIAASNPVIGSGGSRHIQLGVKFIW